ncbi:TraM recognition domain-containing protein [Nocardia sp. NPDC050710]|uniref:caspase, EACC1-associated type n=1 Tax=Nocardia sp. NPDC050710 TaxID=3157220 RepID=UPI0033C10A15
MPDALDGNFSRSQAILIGTWDYSELAPVPAARHSLQRMADLLAGPLCGWPSERVFVVGNQRLPGNLADELVEKFEQASDIALFYFVGHGQYDQDDRLCLAFRDTSTRGSRRTTTSIPFDQVRHAFRASRATTKIAILDCCFAGLAVNPNGTLSGTIELPPAPGAYLMMATGPYSTAWYQLEDEHRRPQTFFTKAFIDVVEHGNPEAGPGLTLDDIFRRAADLLVLEGKPRPDRHSAGYSNRFLFARNIGHSGPPEQPPTVESQVRIPVATTPDPLPTDGEPLLLMNPIVRRKPILRATRRELAPFTEAGARQKATERGLRLGYADAPGVPLGVSVRGGKPLYASYGDTQLDIVGPRRGKTSARVVPAILDAIGAVFVTSTKRDVVDLTREVREAKGSPTFVFDPHGLAGEQPSWCWDPLAWVDPERDGAEMRAARLVAHFADSADGFDADSDMPAAADCQDLLANLFLAAAVGRRSIMDVFDWLTSPHDFEPIVIMRQANHQRAAAVLSSTYNGDPRARDRVFAAAIRIMRCLRSSGLEPWITRSNDRRMFDEHEFIAQNGTLYALSSPGRGSAAPLISALTEAVLDVALRMATMSRDGMLPIPLLAIFDDTPQLLRWRELPRVYSSLGARGIMAMVMLQAWDHGVNVWGADGMADIWAAADIRVIGGGLADIGFARAHLEAMGYPATPTAGQAGAANTASPPRFSLPDLFARARGHARAMPFSVADLLTLPLGHVVVLPSFGAPVLARTLPWWETPHKAEILKANEQRKGFRPSALDFDQLFGATDTNIRQPNE